MYDYIDTGVIARPDLFKLERAAGTAKITKVTMKTISDLSADPEEALRMIEAMVGNNIVIHIEDMGIIDDSPAGKQLLNTIASVLG